MPWINVVLIPASVGKPVELLEVKRELEDMQALVGGYLEAVTMPNNTIYMNEEGKLKQLPANRRATEFVRRHMVFGDFIVGDAFVTGLTRNGWDTSVPLWAIEELVG